MQRWTALGLALGVVWNMGSACGDAPLEGGSTPGADASSSPQEDAASAAATEAWPRRSSDRVARNDAARATGATDAGSVETALDCEDLAELPSKTRYPIVLAHGAGGFDQLSVLSYFHQVPEHLRAAGYAVYVAAMDPFNATTVRGPQLAAFVDRVLACTGAAKVNLVGHSQGGLDARYVVSTLGYADRVASVTTFATPHQGTAVSDMLLGLLPGVTDDLVDFALYFAGELYADPLADPDFRTALETFAVTRIEAFNAANPDAFGVMYYSWAGRAGLTTDGKPACEGADVPNPPEKIALFSLLVPTWAALGGFDGVDNDGLVTVESAKWGHFRGCVPADHLGEIGQPIGYTKGFDQRAFFLAHADYLAAQGH